MASALRPRVGTPLTPKLLDMRLVRIASYLEREFTRRLAHALEMTSTPLGTLKT